MLHKNNPKAFLDENHKPEMAVALTPFTAMCGFREPAEILKFAMEIEELSEAFGQSVVKGHLLWEIPLACWRGVSM